MNSHLHFIIVESVISQLLLQQNCDLLVFQNQFLHLYSIHICP